MATIQPYRRSNFLSYCVSAPRSSWKNHCCNCSYWGLDIQRISSEIIWEGKRGRRRLWEWKASRVAQVRQVLYPCCHYFVWAYFSSSFVVVLVNLAKYCIVDQMYCCYSQKVGVIKTSHLQRNFLPTRLHDIFSQTWKRFEICFGSIDAYLPLLVSTDYCSR